MYPNPGKGDTIKATYVLSIFPFIAVCVGLFFERIEQRSRFITNFLLGAVLLVAIHNLPAMVTHYPLHLR